MITVYTKDTACELLHITLETLDDQLQSGKLSYRKIGDTILFTEQDIKNFLYDCAIEAENTKCRSSVTSVPIGG